MSDLAIKAEGLSKRYRIGQYVGEAGQYRALRDVLTDAMRTPFRRLHSAFSRSRSSTPHSLNHSTTQPLNDYIWALKDVSFGVKQGEVVGIIGRNGAGKTTLLKVLSRITEPTEGRAEMRGRVGSLLEVGTGFHPELTGREKIYLSGAILGMTKSEIKRKFDEIVAFAELEKFIDTPAKRYSRGMWVRAGFSVAAHLEPEILLVDEVLAVGDAAFQKKCLSRMREVGEGGRTILFVSHSMSAITRLCKRAILIDQGRVVLDGPAPEVTSSYLMSDLGTSAERRWGDIASAPGNDLARLRTVRVRTKDGQTTESVDIREPVGIEIEYWVLKSNKVLTANIEFHDSQGICIFVANDSYDPTMGNKSRAAGLWKSTCWVPGNLLSEGRHIVSVSITTLDPVVMHFHERDAVTFQVVDSLDENTARGKYGGPLPGVVRPLLKWTAEHQPSRENSPDLTGEQ